MQIASRRFAGGKNKREIKRARRRRERGSGWNLPERGCSMTRSGDARGEGISWWNGAKGGREERADERVGRRWTRRAGRATTGCESRGGGGRGVRGDHSSSEEKRGLREHTTVPHHTADGGGRLRRWLEEVAGHPRGTIGFGGDPEAEYTDTRETDLIAVLYVRLAP